MAAADYFQTFDGFHDPNVTDRWQVSMKLDASLQVVSADVQVVDPTSTSVDAGTDLVVSSVTFFLLNGEWLIDFLVSGGSADPAVDFNTYYLRCRITESDSTTAERTMKLNVRQL